MSQPTDSPIPVETGNDADVAEVTLVDPADAGDAAARTPRGGHVRGQRIEVTSADLTMYSAITGRAPSAAERERALTWSDGDPMNEQIADATSGGRAVTVASAVLPAHALRPWSPGALSLRLRDIWFNGLSIRVPRPQVSNWLRRLSLALQQGRQRVRQVR